jgi:hypothetical protein
MQKTVPEYVHILPSSAWGIFDRRQPRSMPVSQLVITSFGVHEKCQSYLGIFDRNVDETADLKFRQAQQISGGSDAEFRAFSY